MTACHTIWMETETFFEFGNKNNQTFCLLIFALWVVPIQWYGTSDTLTHLPTSHTHTDRLSVCRLGQWVKVGPYQGCIMDMCKWSINLTVFECTRNSAVEAFDLCVTYMLQSYARSIQRLCRVGPSGIGRGWATLSGTPFVFLSKIQLERVHFVSVLHFFSNRLLLSNQDKGCSW